tara:strand:- start:124 stop:768 length:645 start_codon:yes stop_codon:yes gene_type:complete
MVKSTQINQLPQSENKIEQMITPNQQNEFVNSQRAHSSFQPPVDSISKIETNNEDDISINEVISEINNNKEKDMMEKDRLQYQINDLRKQLYNQVQQNQNMMMRQQQVLNVPQAPSANLINESIDNKMKEKEFIKEEKKEIEIEKENSNWFKKINDFINSNIKLFLVCIFVYMLLCSENLNNFIEEKLNITPQLLNLIKGLFLSIIIIISLQIQ